MFIAGYRHPSSDSSIARFDFIRQRTTFSTGTISFSLAICDRWRRRLCQMPCSVLRPRDSRDIARKAAPSAEHKPALPAPGEAKESRPRPRPIPRPPRRLLRTESLSSETKRLNLPDISLPFPSVVLSRGLCWCRTPYSHYSHSQMSKQGQCSTLRAASPDSLSLSSGRLTRDLAVLFVEFKNYVRELGINPPRPLFNIAHTLRAHRRDERLTDAYDPRLRLDGHNP